MVIIRLLQMLSAEALGDEPSRAQNLLAGKHQHLHPYPSDQNPQADKVDVGEKGVLAVAIKIDERYKTEDGMAQHKGVSQRTSAVSMDVAVDLREPEGEVDEG